MLAQSSRELALLRAWNRSNRHEAGKALSLDAIFSRFTDNRAQVVFQAIYSGGRERSLPVKTILITDGTRTFAVFHARETPLRPSGGSGKLQGLSAVLRTGSGDIPLTELSVLAFDPRILTAPIPEETAPAPDMDRFDLATDPLRFPEAVLIGNREGYYGEAGFKIDPVRARYFRMEGRLFNRLFGEFSPSRGDLVFAKTGAFMGLMVNSQYCAVLTDLIPSARVGLGDAFSPSVAEDIIARSSDAVNQLPPEFQ